MEVTDQLAKQSPVGQKQAVAWLGVLLKTCFCFFIVGFAAGDAEGLAFNQTHVRHCFSHLPIYLFLASQVRINSQTLPSYGSASQKGTPSSTEG